MKLPQPLSTATLPATGAPVLLNVKNLIKNFGARRALDDVSLAIHEGEVTVILGPSGCGKSTLLRCLNGLEPIQAGNLSLRGKPMPGPSGDWRSIRQQVGMVFQSVELFPHLNVIENLLLGPVQVQRRKKADVLVEARVWLRRVGLADRELSYPRELSGGQKQRVAIVRALCLNPVAILFDEVTAALDPEMVREVLDVILELAREGMTMVIVTHEMGFARAVADRVVFMDEGRIVETSPPATFFARPSTERAQRFLDKFLYLPRQAEQEL
jgi:polar amino acid transport system ATP-binding protein